MSGIAVITARGGSKRIPRKNIKSFCGQPIIAYSIKAALESGIFAEVMVSTDDREIAEIAEGYGAKVPFFRSAENSDDYASTADVLLEVLGCYAPGRFDWLCCLYPTAPFVTGERLKQCFKVFNDKGAAALIPIVRFSYPPQRAFIRQAGDRIGYLHPDNAFKRSQDLQPLYHDAGQFYFIRTAELLERKSLVPPETLGFEIAEAEVQDIDTLSDWEMAELKYTIWKKKHEKDGF